MHLISHVDPPFTRRNSIREKKMGRRSALQLTLPSSGRHTKSPPLRQYRSGRTDRVGTDDAKNKLKFPANSKPYHEKLEDAATGMGCGKGPVRGGVRRSIRGQSLMNRLRAQNF
jgi:hypothetical protein